MLVLQIKFKSFLNIYSFCRNFFLTIKKIYLLKLRGGLSNPVLKVSEALKLALSKT